MYATNMYCIFLKDQTGNVLVISVYIVLAMASARVAKQNISCTAHALCFMDWEHFADLGACPNNVSLVVVCGGSVGAIAMHMDFVGGGRLWQMGVKLGVRPGMVFSLVLLVRASRSVAAVGEQSS